MTSSTADPGGARAHARAQAGTRVEAMPILPASAADNRPHGVKPADMLWEETVAAGGYASARLDRGARLRLIDLYGDASPSMLIFNADQPAERLNVADISVVGYGTRADEHFGRQRRKPRRVLRRLE